MYYKIVEETYYSAQFNELPILFIGNEDAVFDFVNERSSDAYDYIEDIELAKEWLRDNGYRIKEIPNLIEDLENGNQIWIQ